jgi:hypothetical protein
MSESKPAPRPTDPLIDEVRQRRRELYASCDNDLNKLAEAIRRVEAEHPEKLRDPRAEKRDEARTASE